MTDEEMVEKYLEITSRCSIEDVEGNLIDITKEIAETYLDGLKAGRPKWHDMRKDPDDLPPVGIGVIISGYLGDMKGLLGLDDWDGVEWTNTDIPGLVREAWCEIPKYLPEK